MINDKLPTIWYGADYNPDQWPEEIWDEDMRLMRLAHVNVATLPVFSWSLLQPAEDRFEFGWLDRIVDKLYANGVYVCMATSTAAQPAWLSKRYPDVLPTGRDGLPRKHGNRVNFCPNSPNYRRYSQGLAQKLAERYGHHPGLVAWHIGNEYGLHCYCDTCAEAFREWLKQRYGSLDAVNHAWNTFFWGHTYHAWSEIDTPSLNGEQGTQGLLLDYDRFQSESSLNCYRGEYDALRAITPEMPITTNLMAAFKPLDYHAWAPYLDMISWDNYPMPGEPFSDIAFKHELMRGLKDGQPWMLMEQTPSQTNWMPYCRLKRPGEMRKWSYQAVAHGADTLMYFQWRRSPGGPEKLHGAVVAHAGHENTRVFGECQTLGQELEQLGSTLLDSRQKARVAVIFDWENWWALGYSKGPSVDLDYVAQVKKVYAALWAQNIATDVIRPEADLSQYDLVVAPVLYMVGQDVAENLKGFVAGGGRLLVTFFSGIVDKTDRVVLGGYPGELKDLMGVWVEEIDALLPGEQNRIVVDAPWGMVQGEYACGLLADQLNLEGAEALAVYGDDFYAGRPVLTRHAYGEGLAYYLATDPEPRFLSDLFGQLCAELGISAPLAAPAGVEIAQRHKGAETFTFVLNHNSSTASLRLPKEMPELLGQRSVGGTIELEPYGVLILQGEL